MFRVQRMNNNNTQNDSPSIKKKDALLPGIILVIIGTIFLLNNYGFTNFDIGKLWPLFLIVPGIMMLVNYFNANPSFC